MEIWNDVEVNHGISCVGLWLTAFYTMPHP